MLVHYIKYTHIPLLQIVPNPRDAVISHDLYHAGSTLVSLHIHKHTQNHTPKYIISQIFKTYRYTLYSHLLNNSPKCIDHNSLVYI